MNKTEFIIADKISDVDEYFKDEIINKEEKTKQIKERIQKWKKKKKAK